MFNICCALAALGAAVWFGQNLPEPSRQHPLTPSFERPLPAQVPLAPSGQLGGRVSARL